MSENPHEILVLTREQVRACDEAALARYGLAGLVLMENAGGGSGP